MRDRNDLDYNYGSSDYGRSRYSSDVNRGFRNEGRDWADRTGDEVRSWFGDDEAERRRRADERNDRSSWDRSRSSYGSASYNQPRSYGSSSYGSENRSTYGAGSGYGASSFDRDSSRSSYGDRGWGSQDRSSYGSSSSYGSQRPYSGNWNESRQGDGYAHGRSYENRNRDWADRAGDEVRSWFGDDEAERRRRMDEVNDRGSWDRNRSWDRDRDRDSWSSSNRW